ncbi:hypothetical protein PLESTF_000512100 [Pleodorina starrii]|nr:hypothetical protein PLESTF_000512100 [Pleodorina starrii]
MHSLHSSRTCVTTTARPGERPFTSARPRRAPICFVTASRTTSANIVLRHGTENATLANNADVVRNDSPMAQSRRGALLLLSGALASAAAAAAVLPEPALADDFVTLPSGIKVLTIREGEGARPQPGDTVVVHWAGFTKGYQGKRIDNTSVRDEPYEFKLGGGQAIKAFELAVENMRAGGIVRVEVPGDHPELGYPLDRGERFTGELISSDLKIYKYRYGPQPAELGGQRALDFVLDNRTLKDFNRTLLFDIKLLAPDDGSLEPGGGRGGGDGGGRGGKTCLRRLRTAAGGTTRASLMMEPGAWRRLEAAAPGGGRGGAWHQLLEVRPAMHDRRRFGTYSRRRLLVVLGGAFAGGGLVHTLGSGADVAHWRLPVVVAEAEAAGAAPSTGTFGRWRP